MNYLRVSSLVVFVIWRGVLTASAHEPRQSNTDVKLRPEKMEVDITMARSAAALLLQEPGPKTAPSFAPEDFTALRENLLKKAPGLYEISLGTTALKAKTSEVSLTVENDVLFHLVYPRPQNQTVDFRAIYLKKMQEDHQTTLVVADETGKPLSWKDLSADQPLFKTVIPTARAVIPPPQPSPPNHDLTSLPIP
jgi:hypothetical protein